MALPNRRGILFADTMIALAIAAALIATLTIAVGSYQRGLHHLSDSRKAMRIAENVLGDLQQGRPPAPPAEDTTVQVKQLPNAPAAPSWRWVNVTVKVQRNSVTLTGMAPAAKEVR